MSVSAHPNAIHGFGKVTVQAPSYNDFALTPNDARVEVFFNSDGTVDVLRLDDPDSNNLYNWLEPTSGAPGDYQIRCTLNAGVLTAASSATGVWLALTSNRRWGTEELGIGTTTANITIEIRKGTGATIDSATGTLTATVDV